MLYLRLQINVLVIRDGKCEVLKHSVFSISDRDTYARNM